MVRIVVAQLFGPTSSLFDVSKNFLLVEDSEVIAFFQVKVSLSQNIVLVGKIDTPFSVNNIIDGLSNNQKHTLRNNLWINSNTSCGDIPINSIVKLSEACLDVETFLCTSFYRTALEYTKRPLKLVFYHKQSNTAMLYDEKIGAYLKISNLARKEFFSLANKNKLVYKRVW